MAWDLLSRGNGFEVRCLGRGKRLVIRVGMGYVWGCEVWFGFEDDEKKI